MSKKRSFWRKNQEGGGGGGLLWILHWELGMVFEETTGVYERMDHKAILKLPVD